MAITILLK